MWCKQMVLDIKCTPLNLNGSDTVVDHMVAMGHGETQTGEPLEQIGKRADFTRSMVGELGATLGCRGCLESGVTNTEGCQVRFDERL